MALYSGIDLHSSNDFVGVINDQDQRVLKNGCQIIYQQF